MSAARNMTTEADPSGKHANTTDLETWIIKADYHVRKLLQEPPVRVSDIPWEEEGTPEPPVYSTSPADRQPDAVMKEIYHRTPALLQRLKETESFKASIIEARGSNATINSDVAACVKRWIIGSERCNLWIRGPANVSQLQSLNVFTAMAVIGSALEAGLRTIIHLARPSDGKESAQVQLRAMAQQLLLQLLALSPPELPPEPLLSPMYISLLLHEDAGARLLLNVIRQLYALVPKPMVCVIEGAQLLEDPLDEDHSKTLLNLFTLLCNGMQETPCEKPELVLCIFSDGDVDILGCEVRAGLLKGVNMESDLCET